MPLPRKPHPKRRASGPRSSRRRVHEKAWLHAKLSERFAELAAQLEDRNKRTYRGAYGAIIYLNEGEPVPPGYQKVEFDKNGKAIGGLIKEKAPSLATGGFSSFFREKEEPSG
jgi:hypothetical protein